MIHERLKCNAVPIQLPIGSEETFKGIIDLVEMDADIYYDELGKDMRVEDIPEDMMELAEEYRTKLLDAVRRPGRRDHDAGTWTVKTDPQRDDARPLSVRRTIENTDGSRDLRHLLPEQGRSEAAGCHRGLYALPCWTFPRSRA